MNPLTWVVNHATLAVTGVLALVILAFAYEAYQEAETRTEVISGFGGKTKRATGGWLNVVLVLVVSAVGALIQALHAGADLAGAFGGLLPNAPVLAVGLGSVAAGGLVIRGHFVMTWYQFVGVFGILLVLAWAYRTDFEEVGN